MTQYIVENIILTTQNSDLPGFGCDMFIIGNNIEFENEQQIELFQNDLKELFQKRVTQGKPLKAVLTMKKTITI